MTWHAYRLVFRLVSPLHIGWRKVGNLMQTRYYVPGRVWWGAITSTLTQRLEAADYASIGREVADHIRFGYYFVAEDPAAPLYPLQKRGILYGGSLCEAEFEGRYLSSLASTAIAAEAGVAQEGSLHELEFIVPSLALGRPVYLVGHLFVQSSERITALDDEVEFQGIPLFSQAMASLQIGGERRYGFGRMVLCQNQCGRTNDLFGYPLNQQDDQWRVTVRADDPILAHAALQGLDARGSIEPLVSREWTPERGPGRQHRLLGLCYTPGSVVASETAFVIGRYGIWEQAAMSPPCGVCPNT